MLFHKEIRKPILALIFISLGGWMLHFRVHSITAHTVNFLPFLLGLVDIVITPVLFNYRKTVIVAYLINGIGVIIGSIAMAVFSIYRLAEPVTLSSILFKTILSDIFILLSKLFIGQLILSYYYPTGLGRLFTPFWWVRHFCYLSIIFAAGHFLWR
jgi:small-conductance mechanosensitive channel